MRNILVAGGAGFIGSHLCDALLARGDRVFCLDNLMRGTKENIRTALAHKNFAFTQGDAADLAFLKEYMGRNEIDFVFHLAANSDIRASAMDPRIEYQSTLSTTWALLYAMRENQIRQFFFASTSAVYGERCDENLTEEDALSPISYYGAAKAASEAFIRAFCHMNDMDACVFRFANVIGPRLTHGVIYDFIRKLRADPTTLQVLGNGTQAKPYIYADDLIRAILQLHDKASGVEIYNVGVESCTKVSEIAEIVCREMGLPDARIEYGTENIGWKGDVPRFRFDLSKIHATGWRAERTSGQAVTAAVREALACRR